MADDKKAFSWEEEDKKQAASPAPSKSNFTWSDADAGGGNPAASEPGAFQTKKGAPIQNARAIGVDEHERQPTFGSEARSAGLGFASGITGAPESLTPLKDIGEASSRDIENRNANPVTSAFRSATLGPAEGLYNIGKGVMHSAGEMGHGVGYQKPSDLLTGPSGNLDPEEVAHGAGSMVGQLAQIGGARESVAGEPTGAVRSLARIGLEDGKPKPIVKLAIGGERARHLAELADPEGAAYEKKGMDLMRRGREQDAIDRKAASDARAAAKAPPPTPGPTEGPPSPNASVLKLPIPRELIPGEKVGYNASTPRRLLLNNALQGRPGAGEMLRNAGRTPLYVGEDIGSGPRGGERISLENIGKSSEPQQIQTPERRTGTANDRPQVTYKPSEKAVTMSEKPRDLGREFDEGELTHDIERSKSILRNPNATDEDRAVAGDRLREAMERRASGTRR